MTAAAAAGRPVYRRIVLKLSGEALAGSQGYGIDPPVLDRVGADIATDAIVSNLSIARRQLVEIAKALGVDAKLLILDEPTASLSRGEAEKLFALVRRLAQSGVGIVYVSHRLEEIAPLVDRVTVLRDGRITGNAVAIDGAVILKATICVDGDAVVIAGEVLQEARASVDKRAIQPRRPGVG